jgi:hypothetical protein
MMRVVSREQPWVLAHGLDSVRYVLLFSLNRAEEVAIVQDF